jgi:hypothetical protein
MRKKACRMIKKPSHTPDSSDGHQQREVKRSAIEEYIADQFAQGNHLDNILSRGKPASASSDTMVSSEAQKQELLKALFPAKEETERVGALLNAFFGEYNPAVRSYAYAKHGMNSTGDALKELEAFLENTNPDLGAAELQRLGWKSFEKLTTDLSIPVHLMEKAREAAGVADNHDAYIQTPESIAIRDKKVVPILRAYEDAHALFDIGMTEQERQQNVIDQVPGYALVTKAMMHDDNTRGLRAAIKKKVFDEPLSDTEKHLLEEYQTVVEAVEGMLTASGLGYATAPCSQVHRASSHASAEWKAYMRETNEAVQESQKQNHYVANTHFKEAMQHHEKALRAYKAMHEGLIPVCELVESQVEVSGEATVDPARLDKAKQLITTIPWLGENDKIVHNLKRFTNTVKTMFKPQNSTAAERNAVTDYFERSMGINLYAQTSAAGVETLTGQIEALQENMPSIDGGKMSFSDNQFRDVYMGLRALNDRLEMMQTAAEQLYVDMGRITGVQNKEWLAAEEAAGPGGISFVPPENPTPKLVKAAQEIQRICLSQQGVAAQCREQLSQTIDAIGGTVDRFDIAHDFFSRLKTLVGEQVESMQARQDAWDKSQPAAAKKIS